jgi:hypothetical protein
MNYINYFTSAETEKIINRINQLTATTPAKWGKMNVAQMLAHCCVSYEMVYTDKHKSPPAFVKFILKLLVKKTVVGSKPYKKNSGTAPAFLITDAKEFEAEKIRLIGFINQSLKDGKAFYANKESLSFGVLSIEEWATLFYKHLDHHLTQFGV